MKNINRKNNLILRAKILQTIRTFFDKQGFLEVETPLLLNSNAPEEYIDPVKAGKQYLQTSPELCMKRLLCRGHDKIYQISHCWRQAERGRNHLPEFTILEWYRSNSDYIEIMNDCEKLLKAVEPLSSEKTADYFTKPMSKISIENAFKQFCKVSMVEAIKTGSFDEQMGYIIEPSLPKNPIVLFDYPSEKAALARLKKDLPNLAERFELYVGGVELANAFSELNDPEEQRCRFNEANKVRIEQGLESLPMPENFLAELGQMPPSAGIALGIDRLTMLLMGADSIDEVVAFTPEEL